MTDVFEFSRGTLPLLISVPHAGTRLPPSMREHLTDAALALPDTDWFVDRLYEFAAATGASVIKANYSRTVIDLNRPPDDAPLYPGQAGTGLCPTTRFDGEPLYKDGTGPDCAGIERRISRFWTPYHDRISAELARLQGIHGTVLLWDGHSIRSHVPRLFEGRLPDLNIGTADGKSCAPAIANKVVGLAEGQTLFSAVLNGRFKGGYITRHYGNPAEGVHAVQLEIAQACYMSETQKPSYDKARAGDLIGVLGTLLTGALEALPSP